MSSTPPDIIIIRQKRGPILASLAWSSEAEVDKVMTQNHANKAVIRRAYPVTGKASLCHSKQLSESLRMAPLDSTVLNISQVGKYNINRF
jgi:hypothetical protein